MGLGSSVGAGRFEHETARFQAMRSTVLDALVRHSLISERPTVRPLVPLLAQAHPVAAVSVVVAIVRTPAPLTTVPSPAIVTSTRVINAASVTTAPALTNRLAVISNGSRRAHTPKLLLDPVHLLLATHSVARAIVAAWLRA